jgi:hypothetical protein
MCEAEYNGCPQCGWNTDDIEWRESISGSRTYTIDEDGDIWGDPEDDVEVSDGGMFHCCNCGHDFHELDTGLTPESCDCDECEPPEPDDPDELVVLVRSRNDRSFCNPPPEIALLYSRRSIPGIVCRMGRAEELRAENFGSYFRLVQTDNICPEYLPYQIPEPEEVAA